MVSGPNPASFGSVKERMINKQSGILWIRQMAVGAWLVTGMAMLSTVMHAQVQARQPNYPGTTGTFGSSSTLQLPSIPATTPITANATVVEDVIARINDQVITRSEYERAQQQLLQEAQQQNEPPAEFQDRSQNLLRDMIDQQLLLSKGKELGISGDAETMRRLDDIRKQNHLESMEALEKAAQQQGVSFEDFKQGIRNNVITQQVVRDEVGRRINMTHAQEEAYYNAHSKDFEVPEQVHLSEILIPTPENATDAQVNQAQAKADDLEAKLKSGSEFAQLAKTFSGGPTASAGGDLGDFKRGQLGDVLEKATFPLPKGGFTEPIRTRQGFVILRVDSHQAAGVPPLADVEPQVQEAIYMNALQPALRAYLTKARDEAYVDVKPGFVDAGSNRTAGKPLFTTYTPPPPKKKVLKHQAAEQQKAQRAQEQLAAAREKLAEKQAAKAAAQAAKNGGAVNVSKPVKPPKVRREKVRFGQAPRNALPPAPVEQAETSNPPLAGQAPGAAMGGSTESVTSISTGTGADEDPLAPKAGPTRKTRFSDRQREQEEQRAQANFVKAESKASTRPLKATSQETADEKQQAAPLGLNGDTVKKKKPKRAKGEPKERLQEKAKPAEPAPVAPTVNPALGTTAVTSQSQQSAPASKPSADTTALPPANTAAPGAPPQGQPIPAATSASPGAPATTTPQPR